MAGFGLYFLIGALIAYIGILQIDTFSGSVNDDIFIKVRTELGRFVRILFQRL